MDLKEMIKDLREEKKKTHSQLAAILGKSEGAIRSWETGRSRPDVDTLVQLSAYFECTTDYLLGLSEDRNEKARVYSDELLQKISGYNSLMQVFPPADIFSASLKYALDADERAEKLNIDNPSFIKPSLLYSYLLGSLLAVFQQCEHYGKSISPDAKQVDIIKKYMDLSTDLLKMRKPLTELINAFTNHLLYVEALSFIKSPTQADSGLADGFRNYFDKDNKELDEFTKEHLQHLQKRLKEVEANAEA